MKQTRKMWAKITFQFSGLHHWPKAPMRVYWLKHMHRHVFHVTVWVEQFHNERDVEYLQLKEALEDCHVNNMRLGSLSCEEIAEQILEYARDFCLERFTDAKHRDVKVEVLEDGENGALVEEVVE